MAAPLKVISINIEGNKHLTDVERLLAEEQPDVVCLQEVFALDMPRLLQATGLQGTFVPTMDVDKENKYNIAPRGHWGVALLTSLPHQPVQSFMYSGTKGEIPVFREPNSSNRVVLTTQVEKDGWTARIATTHFTWSPGGQATDEQRQDAKRMRAIIDTFEEVIFCGDFNAPRGGEMHTQIGAGLADAVPPEVTTTIDPDRHYAGALELVVDGMFYTESAYQVEAARVQSGVSDHQAVIGVFKKISAQP